MNQYTRAVGAAALALAGVVGAGVASAAPVVTELQCAIEDTIEQSHGLTLQASPSEFRSTGHGALTCTGVLDGVAVEGTGPFEMTGRTADTWCGSGSGTIQYAAQLPRKDGRGKVRLSGSQDWNRVGLALVTRATSGPDLAGPMYAQPLNGDCSKEPVTLVRLRAPLLVTR